jgi:hypothetical protein
MRHVIALYGLLHRTVYIVCRLQRKCLFLPPLSLSLPRRVHVLISTGLHQYLTSEPCSPIAQTPYPTSRKFLRHRIGKSSLVGCSQVSWQSRIASRHPTPHPSRRQRLNGGQYDRLSRGRGGEMSGKRSRPFASSGHAQPMAAAVAFQALEPSLEVAENVGFTCHAVTRQRLIFLWTAPPQIPERSTSVKIKRGGEAECEKRDITHL